MNLAQLIDGEAVRERRIVQPRVMRRADPGTRKGSVHDIRAALRGNPGLSFDELYVAANGQDRHIFGATLSYLRARGKLTATGSRGSYRYSLA